MKQRRSLILRREMLAILEDTSPPLESFEGRVVLGRNQLLTLFVLITASLLLSTWPGAAAAKDTGIVVTFAARTPQNPVKNMLEGEHHGFSPGHVYIIVGVKTNIGVHEDLLGFYPRGEGRAAIKGPGMLKAEYRCGTDDDCKPQKKEETLKRLSETGESVTISITAEQRQKLYQDISGWNEKQYRLTDQNCIDFMGVAATSLGYPTPSRSATQTPMDYIKALRPMVEREAKRREAAEQKRVAEEAARQRQIEADQAAERERLRQEAQRAQEEARSRAAATAEARRIPAGWVRCGCPGLHTAYGKVVDNVRWHVPDAPFCPR